MNYTSSDVPFTRIVEHKHFEYGAQPKTVITRKYPAEWKQGMEPYYPVNDEKNTAIYEKYRKLGREQGIIFGGRLGEYRYADMDKVLRSALDTVRSECSF